MRRMLGFLLGAAFVISAGCASAQVLTLFGGNGGHNNGDSINDGFLVRVDQTNAAVTPIGHPAGVPRITGLAFDSSGALFASTAGGGGFPPPPGPVTFSNLLRIDPLTGATLATIGPITDAGTPIGIADLALQPGTGTLFGIRAPLDQMNGQGKLYTINKITGAATLVGDTGHFFGSIAFAPNGTLFMASEDLGPMGTMTNTGIRTLNPANGANLTFVPTTAFYGGLAVRPTDSALFGSQGDFAEIFRIDPLSGSETLVGGTGQNFIGGLAFGTVVPEPGALALLAGALVPGAALAWRARQKRGR